MSADLYLHRSRSSVVRVEDVLLSSVVSHPLQGRTIVDHTFRIHWERASSSTMRLTHGGVELDASFSSYVDGAFLDSFISSVEETFVPFVKRHGVGSQSTLCAEVVMTIHDTAYLRIDDPVVARIFPGQESLRWALDDLERSRAMGLEIYANLPSTWGVKCPNAFAHEPGQLTHLVRHLGRRDVAERVVWHSASDMLPEPQVLEGLRANLIKEFSRSPEEVL